MVIFAALILSGLTFLLLKGYIVCYAGSAQAHTWLVLNEAVTPPPFWEEFLNSGRFYHVLTPLQGLLIHLFLIGFYSLMDFFSNRMYEGRQQSGPGK